MKNLKDFRGLNIRLTDERLSHILDHPEMKGMENLIKETLLNPEYVVQSLTDSEVYLYYKLLKNTRLGDKFLCVVVKNKGEDIFYINLLFD